MRVGVRFAVRKRGTMTEDQKDKLGRLCERVDNFAHAVRLPISAELHMKALREAIPEICAELKGIYRELTGEDPWEDA